MDIQIDSEDEYHVSFTLGQDVRSESRLLQDEKWKNAVADGRKHVSHREANTIHAKEFRQTIEQFHIVQLFMRQISAKRSLLSRLNYETLQMVVDYAYGHGSLIPLDISLRDVRRSYTIPKDPFFKVCTRKRPLNHYESGLDAYDCIHAEPARSLIMLHDGRMSRDGRRLSMSHRFYTFDKIFGEKVTNEAFCADEVDALVDGSLSGMQSTLICFGQTGTGKTYTLMAALEHTLKRLCGKRLELSFFEIHGKKCYDLLSNRRVVHLRSDGEEVVHVCGTTIAKTTEKTSSAELLALFDEAMRLRSSEVTERNPISSRSHAICSIKILMAPEGRDQDPKEPTTERKASSMPANAAGGDSVHVGGKFESASESTRHCLAIPPVESAEASVDPVSETSSRSYTMMQAHCVLKTDESAGHLLLVDLAGSERNYETIQMTAAQHRESAFINSSLMALKDCFRAYHAARAGKRTVQRQPARCLSTKHDRSVARPPYRASLLTRVLKQCFVPSERQLTVIVATVSPSPTDTQHSINTIEHVLLMAPHLANQSLETTVEVPMGGGPLSHVPVESWTCDELSVWLAYADGGRFAQLALPPGVDGAAMMQLNITDLSALCAGNLRQARAVEEGFAWVESAGANRGTSALGRALWASLRREKLQRETAEEPVPDQSTHIITHTTSRYSRIGWESDTTS